MCQILKPQSTLNKELFVVNELAELMTKLQELLNREEVRSDEYFNHMNNLFKAIYIHLEKTADNVSAGVGDRVENILTNKLDSGVVRYLGGITRSLSLLFHYNLLLLLLTWLFKTLYWLLRILVRLIKCVVRALRPRKSRQRRIPNKSVPHIPTYKHNYSTRKHPQHRFSSAPP